MTGSVRPSVLLSVEMFSWNWVLRFLWISNFRFLNFRFLNLKKNLSINFPWICSITKIYVIYCVPAQILFLGKHWNVDQNALIHSDCTIFNPSMKVSFFTCWYKLIKIKSWSVFLVGHGQNWVWLVCSPDSKVDCVSDILNLMKRMNW